MKHTITFTNEEALKEITNHPWSGASQKLLSLVFPSNNWIDFLNNSHPDIKTFSKLDLIRHMKDLTNSSGFFLCLIKDKYNLGTKMPDLIQYKQLVTEYIESFNKK